MKLFYSDVETTGLDPAVQEIFQFSYIIEIDKKVIAEGNLKMAPARPEKADPEALEVTGVSLKEMATYPPKNEAHKALVTELEKHIDRYDKADKFIWVGQNPGFDIGFSRAWFKDCGDKYFGCWFDPRPADLISLAVACRLRGLIQPENFKLGTLCNLFGIKLVAHDALNDIRATRECFHRLMQFLKKPAESAAGGSPSGR